MKLTNEFIERQKSILLNEKNRLQLEIKKLKEYPDYEAIGDDAVQEVLDYENNISIDNQLEAVLAKVNKALKAVENGTYGKCSKCQQNIEEGRLDIIPYADVCVSCDRK